MRSVVKYYSFMMAATILISISCRGQHNNSEIESALKTYDRLIKKMDADSIAMLYAPDGDLGNTAHGRDSIRKFLSSFKNVSVLYVASVPGTIKISQDTAMQTGRYKQIALVNNKDTLNLGGTFIARWIWIKAEGWRIKRMETNPDK
ncbi:MAG: nuclear transport factor 2 family protein [Bacteroidota bacterium]|nr:nuclear transport factor 2 family protein [Bacteroidota bacterium]